MSGTVQIVTEGASGTREVLKSSNQALSVNAGGAPGIAQTPDTPFAIIDATSANLLMGFRVTVGAGDDVVASERLANGTPNTITSPADGSVTFTTNTAVSRVDFVGIKNNATDATGCIGTAGTAVEADLQMTTVTFTTAVNKIVISGIAEGTGQLAVVGVEGYTYG